LEQVKPKAEVANLEKQGKWVRKLFSLIIFFVRNDNKEKYSRSYYYWNKGFRRFGNCIY